MDALLVQNVACIIRALSQLLCLYIGMRRPNQFDLQVESWKMVLNLIHAILLGFVDGKIVYYSENNKRCNENLEI